MQISVSGPNWHPTSLSGLLEDLRVKRGPKPALIWYDAQGLRVELSGRVLENWIAKTANLFNEEIFDFDTAQGVVELRSHWKSLVIVLGALAGGARVKILTSNIQALAEVFGFLDTAQEPESFTSPSILVTERPAGQAGNAGTGRDARDASGAGTGRVTGEITHTAVTSEPEATLRVALDSFATAFSGDMNPGDLDYAAEVRSQPDAWMNPVPLQIGELTVIEVGSGRETVLTQADLLSDATLSGLDSSLPTEAAVLIRAKSPRGTAETGGEEADLAQVLVSSVQLLARGARVVVAPSVSAQEAEILQRIIREEHVVASLDI